MTERGELVRAGRGIYMRPVKSRFGRRPPTVEQPVEAVAQQRGETIVSSGAAAANALDLTTQAPVRSVYLTSGRSRTMNLGKQRIELKHVHRWQLALADRPAGVRSGRLHGLDPRRPRRHYRGLSESSRRPSLASWWPQHRSFRRGSQEAWAGLRMADRFLALSKDDRREALAVAADCTGRPIHLLEKMSGSSGHLSRSTRQSSASTWCSRRHLALESLWRHPTIFGRHRSDLRYPGFGSRSCR